MLFVTLFRCDISSRYRAAFRSLFVAHADAHAQGHNKAFTSLAVDKSSQQVYGASYDGRVSSINFGNGDCEVYGASHSSAVVSTVVSVLVCECTCAESVDRHLPLGCSTRIADISQLHDGQLITTGMDDTIRFTPVASPNLG